MNRKEYAQRVTNAIDYVISRVNQGQDVRAMHDWICRTVSDIHQDYKYSTDNELERRWSKQHLERIVSVDSASLVIHLVRFRAELSKARTYQPTVHHIGRK